MRVVIDTNVFISALVFGGLPEQVLLRVIKEHQLVLSAYIITEINRILRVKFQIRPPSLRLLQEAMREAEMVYFDPYVHILTDEPDNRILETAEQGQAEYVITGDKLLLDLKQYKDIVIIKPADFL